MVYSEHLSISPFIFQYFPPDSTVYKCKNIGDGDVEELRKRISHLTMENLHLFWLLVSHGIRVPLKYSMVSHLTNAKVQTNEDRCSIDRSEELSTPGDFDSALCLSKSLTASQVMSNSKYTSSSVNTDRSKTSREMGSPSVRYQESTNKFRSSSSSGKEVEFVEGIDISLGSTGVKPLPKSIRMQLTFPERVSYKSGSVGPVRGTCRIQRKSRGRVHPRSTLIKHMCFSLGRHADSSACVGPIKGFTCTHKSHSKNVFKSCIKDENISTEKVNSLRGFPKTKSAAFVQLDRDNFEVQSCFPKIKQDKESRSLGCKPYVTKDVDRSKMMRHLLRVTLKSHKKTIPE